MGRMETFAPAPPAAISRVLATFDRHQLEGFIAVAIDLLDLADGDPDLEEDDDPGQCTEDEISTDLHVQWGVGAGCIISDPDKAVDDDPCDDYNDDREEEEAVVPCYGMDQTAGIISNERGLERVQDFRCGPGVPV